MLVRIEFFRHLARNATRQLKKCSTETLLCSAEMLERFAVAWQIIWRRSLQAIWRVAV